MKWNGLKLYDFIHQPTWVCLWWKWAQNENISLRSAESFDEGNVWNEIIIKRNDKIYKKNSESYSMCKAYTINHSEAKSMKKSSVGDT